MASILTPESEPTGQSDSASHSSGPAPMPSSTPTAPPLAGTVNSTLGHQPEPGPSSPPPTSSVLFPAVVAGPPTTPPSTTPPSTGPDRRPPRSGRSRAARVAVTASAFLLGGAVASAGFAAGRLGSDISDADSPTVATGDVVQAATGQAAPAAPAITFEGGEPVADVAKILGPSVVQVETNLGQGSGVVFDEGLLLTNHHVVADSSAVRVRTSDGRVIEAEVLGSDPRNDIAVLAVEGGALTVATIGSSADIEVGELTVAIGSPFQLQQTVTSGIVSSLNRPVPNLGGSVSAMIQTDAPINPGNSGGALANRNGELIGINTSIRTDGLSNTNLGIGFAVPIDTAVAVAERIVAGDSLEPGVLGVEGRRQDDGLGVPIAQVTPDSGADAAGVLAGDRVLTIDGAPVTDIVELTGLVQSKFDGDQVELEIDRNGERLTVTATLS